MKLTPAERFLMLSQVVDELPETVSGELLRVVASACFAVVRSLQGTTTEGEARFAVDRARDMLLAEAAKSSQSTSVVTPVNVLPTRHYRLSADVAGDHVPEEPGSTSFRASEGPAQACIEFYVWPSASTMTTALATRGDWEAWSRERVRKVTQGILETR